MGSSSQEMIYVPCLYRYDAEDCVHTKKRTNSTSPKSIQHSIDSHSTEIGGYII